ncbi:hypothetical protein [Desulfobulbus propionicus]
MKNFERMGHGKGQHCLDKIEPDKKSAELRKQKDRPFRHASFLPENQDVNSILQDEGL